MWLLIGLVLGAALIALILWISSKKIAVKWYEWLIGILGLLLLLLMIQNITGSIREMEIIAAWQFLWLIGVPALILLVLAYWLPWRRHRNAGS
jgi:uncharacterized membrane protein